MNDQQQPWPPDAAPDGQATTPAPSGGVTSLGGGSPTSSGLSYAISHGPAFAMLAVTLQPGQSLTAEAGSMVARHRQVQMDVRLNANEHAGFLANLWAMCIALLRKLIVGETFFVNRFSCPSGGTVWIAPSLSGQITYRRMAGETLVLTSGAYLAHSGDLNLKLRFGGMRALLSKEGLFFLEVSGTGDLFFNSYGGIHAIEVEGSYIVDNGHLVGWDGDLDFTIRSAGGGVMGLVASGEGLVCELRGRGRVYLQSRNLSSLVDWLTPMLP